MVIHELTHLFLSLIAGCVFAAYFKNNRLIIYSILIGVFVDIDHLFDYFLYKKSLAFNLHEFFSGFYFDFTNKVILPLHGFEYVIALAILGILSFRKDKKTTRNSSQRSVANAHSSVLNPRKGSVLLVLSLSLFFHLTYDTIYYRPKWPTYFISYRIYHHFNHNYFWLKGNLNGK